MEYPYYIDFKSEINNQVQSLIPKSTEKDQNEYLKKQYCKKVK